MNFLSVPDPFPITKNFVMLCEGKADNEFFRKLISHHKLPEFDFPFPPEAGRFEPDDISGLTLYGSSGYKDMLKSIATYLGYFPELKDQLKGILIVADATGKPSEVLKNIRKQVKAVGNFGIPAKPMDTTASADGYPSLSILLLPINGVGGIETVCLGDIGSRYRIEMECLESFLECCPTGPLKWPAEKLGKAKFHALVAATYKHDPSRALSMAFKKQTKQPPVLEIGADCFVPIAEYIRDFCRSVEGP